MNHIPQFPSNPATLNAAQNFAAWSNANAGYTKTMASNTSVNAANIVEDGQGTPRLGAETRGKQVLLLPCIQAFGPTEYASQSAYEAAVGVRPCSKVLRCI